MRGINVLAARNPMNASIIVEHRFVQTPDGRVWTQTVFPAAFWEPYLLEFNELQILARVEAVESVDDSYMRADGERVHFAPLPAYRGGAGFIRSYVRVRSAILKSLPADNAIFLWMPSPIANTVLGGLIRSARPFAVEVVGDPYDVFSSDVFTHPLRRVFQRWMTDAQKRGCARSIASHYVTERALQKRYPPGRGTFTTGFSNVQLREDSFTHLPYRVRDHSMPLRIVSVGSMEHLYKAQDVTIAAVASRIRSGANVTLTFVGDGSHRRQLQTQASIAGIEDCVRFLGQLPAGKAVTDVLDESDIFVLPSRQEGLPRAMLEAMARGLPCIGSNVGGIPELIRESEIVAPNDPEALARVIQRIGDDSGEYSRISTENLEKARQFSWKHLVERRQEFCAQVKVRTLKTPVISREP